MHHNLQNDNCPIPSTAEGIFVFDCSKCKKKCCKKYKKGKKPCKKCPKALD